MDNLMDISEAAAYLSVSRATIYRLISRGRIRTYRILNHAVRIRQRELDEFGASVRTWPAFPDSGDALAYLKRHYRLAILSNVDRASFTQSNAKLGVTFDHIFTAEDIGSYKPDLRNFEYALARLREAGVEKRAVLHVAQSLFHDHVPAKLLGLASVWIDRRAGRPGAGATPPAAATPDWRFESLAEFAAADRRLRARVP